MRAVQSLLDGWMEKPPEDTHMRRFWEILLDQPLSNGRMLEVPEYSPEENKQKYFSLREKVRPVFSSYAGSDDRVLSQR